ncbi:MAG: hypothetical protein KDK30_18975, partial [Leptospiraceae bacterium]|nr:hypothetical protein [Leptospiraceae bacterium]
ESPTVGNLDWDFNLFYLEIFVRPLRDFHQLPLWNPYSMGGFPINIHPGIKSFGPDTLLALLFGTLTGAKLTVILHYGVGFTGAWYLTRRVLGFSLWPVLFFSFFWLYSGWLPLHLYAGHANFSPILYAPFVVAFFIQAVRRNNLWYAVAAGFVLEIMLLSAAFYAVVYILIAGGVYVCAHELIRRPGLITGPSTARVFLLSAGAFLVLSAHRWIPLLLYATGGAGFHDFPDDSGHSLAQVWQMFTDRTGDPEAVQWAGQPYLWWEYGNYTGAYFWIVLIGLSFFIRRGDIPIVIVCCILLLLVLGDFAQWSPYNIMRALEIPILRHLRVPSRWSMPLLFTTAILG